MERKMYRAEKAGEHLGKSIIEMVNLMYQNNTAENFYRGLLTVLNKTLKPSQTLTPANLKRPKQCKLDLTY